VQLTNTSRRRIGIGPQSRHVQDKDGNFVPRENYDSKVIFLDSTDDDLVEADAKRRGAKVERYGRKRELSPAQAKRLKNCPTLKAVGPRLGLELVG
jgi:hypothetical protein